MGAIVAATVGHPSHGWAYLTFLFFLAAAILTATGVQKLLRPDPTARALAGAGSVSRPRAMTRVVGTVETAVGLVALVRPGPVEAAAVAVLYVAFAGFLAFLVRFRPGIRSCGCLGTRDLPPSMAHAAVDLLAAAVSVAVLHQVHQPVFTFLRRVGPSSLPVLAVLAATAYALYGLIAYVPQAVRSFAPPPLAPRRGGHARQSDIDQIFNRAGIGPDDISLWGGIRLAGPDPGLDGRAGTA